MKASKVQILAAAAGVALLAWGPTGSSAQADGRPAAAQRNDIPAVPDLRAGQAGGHVVPHVLPQADRLAGRVLSRQPDRSVPVTVFADGCDRGYGTNEQCIPVRAPGNRPVTCQYLRGAGYLAVPLPVHNDHLRLVRGGVVCG